MPSPVTTATRNGINTDTAFGAVVPPLHLTSTFSFEALGMPRPFDYTRGANPTRSLLADTLARLEGGAGGAVVASGMAAVTLALELIPAGGHVIAPHDCYGGTWRLFDVWAKKGRIRVTFLDFQDEAALTAALGDNPALIWVETPSNPLLRVVDIAALADAAHRAGALCLVDNTFLSPLLQQPLALGADLVLHSTTKYINGHSDVVGGALIGRTEALAEEIVWWSNCNGLSGAPFDSYLTLRGLRTLAPRMQAAEANARRLAEYLSDEPAVGVVHYPGLPGDPGHALASRQQKGYGAMLSFTLRGGLSAARRFVDGLHCFTLAESLGGVESLISHPATMSHASMAADARARAGISDSLLRLSVGIEAPDDLVADLAEAFRRIATSPAPAPSAAFAEGRS